MVNREKALKSLWQDRCAVYIYKGQTDEKTKVTTHTEKLLMEDIPCKLSISNIAAAGEGVVATVSQAVKLFLAVNLKIPPGCKIVVTRPTGHILTYKASGMPGYFTYHQEINLTLFTGWA